MDILLTVFLGALFMVLPVIAGRFMWKNYDRYFGRNDPVYMDTLTYFVKKLGLSLLVIFVVLSLGMVFIFQNQAPPAIEKAAAQSTASASLI